MNDAATKQSFDFRYDEREALREELVRRIAEDARRSPEAWLRDAEVPEGGE